MTSNSRYSTLNRLRTRSLDSTGIASSSPRHYFTRKFATIISDKDLPERKDPLGLNTPVGIFFLLIRLTIPLAYIYICLILVRELWPTAIQNPVLSTYLPFLVHAFENMQKTSKFVDLWVVLEVIFCILQKVHIQWLQYKDPIEASLQAAPMLEDCERASLWCQMMNQIMGGDPTEFIRGWFFDEALENITKYDVLDFLAWSMFEGRNQEHLTNKELVQLNSFLNELEWRLSFHLYGDDGGGDESFVTNRYNLKSPDGEFAFFEKDIEDEILLRDRFSSRNSVTSTSAFANKAVLQWNDDVEKRVKPRKEFHFQANSHDETPLFFSNIIDFLQKKFGGVDFHPVQDIRNFVAVKRQQLNQAEEHAMVAASNMYGSFVHRGSSFDNLLSAISTATHQQLNEIWVSVCKVESRVKERFMLQQQLKGYRLLLDKMRSMSAAAPTRQMAELLRKITKCNESLLQVEKSAFVVFLKAAETSSMNFLGRKEPQRYAKYSNDPLLGLATYPLMFNLLVLVLTDGLLRVLLKRRGFRRMKISSTIYYYHPGLNLAEFDCSSSDDDVESIPFVFCHGIGIGLIYYLSFIDELIKSGKPILLPEIPYVCGFRPWVSRNSILTPVEVVNCLTAMLASHGYLKANFIGHSYGTSWLSYMCKYASHTMASVLFLDPVCFCLHHPCLTKNFVYQRPDFGAIGHIITTDVIVNWTIQRSFPWSRIILFIEDIPDIPCSICLSDLDELIPAAIVENDLQRSGANIIDYELNWEHKFDRDGLNAMVFRGDRHGDWTDRLSAVHCVANIATIMSEQCETNKD